jgi:hypothetical protein
MKTDGSLLLLPMALGVAKSAVDAGAGAVRYPLWEAYPSAPARGIVRKSDGARVDPGGAGWREPAGQLLEIDLIAEFAAELSDGERGSYLSR